MNATDTIVLLKGLKEYYNSLEKHLQQLRSKYQQLEVSWRGFNTVAKGDYADQFRSGWLRTEARFRDYIQQSEQIKVLLKECIQTLDSIHYAYKYYFVMH